ncbi:MAG: response regulator transcription factor [Anaerolineales bacterium]
MDRLSVLLVDDNPTFQRITSQFLAKYPQFELIGWAKNGSQAIDMARAEQPDVVLLDLGMPDISGLEVLPILRSLLSTSVIIVLTLLEAGSYRTVALKSGADGFLSKSEVNSELPGTIMAIAEGKGLKFEAV